MRIALIVALGALLASCGSGELTPVQIADANAKSALNETSALRSRLDTIEEEKDELVTRLDEAESRLDDLE